MSPGGRKAGEGGTAEELANVVPMLLLAGFLADIRRFEKAVGVADTRRGKSRASSAFGMLYAAGSFAKARGILPKDWNCLNACLAAYRNYQAQPPEQTPLITRLMTIAQRLETLDIRGVELTRMSDAEVERHGAFIRTGTKRRVELPLTDAIRDAYFPEWARLKDTAEFRSLNLPASSMRANTVKSGRPGSVSASSASFCPQRSLLKLCLRRSDTRTITCPCRHEVAPLLEGAASSVSAFSR